MKKRLLIAFSLILVMAGCRKDPDFDLINFGYEYFPNLTGSFIEYRVQHITFGITTDTTEYFMREFVSETFIDNVGTPANIVERAVRSSVDEPYTTQLVFTQKRTPTNAQRVIDNQRVIHMVFPLQTGQSWDGNGHNVMEPWMFSTGPIGVAHSVGPLTFDETVRINQRENVNLVEQQIAWEVYAKGIGLVERYYKNVAFQNFELVGEEFHWRITGFGGTN
jgi:hypothetical protein